METLIVMKAITPPAFERITAYKKMHSGQSIPRNHA